MKQITLLVVMLSLSVGMLFAQPVFGVRGGLNIASFTGEDNMDDFDSKLGFHAGAMMQSPLGNNFIIQPEVLYTMKGATSEFKLLGVQNELTGTANYIEIPVLIKYNIELSSVQIQPYFGPSIGVLLVGEITNKKSIGGISSTDTISFKDDMNALEAGLNFGADAVLMQNLMVGLRFNLGLTEIVKKDSKYKNNVFMVNLGFLFGN
ncbi:MAG: porin family protein [Candidatus Cloacimonetes bacterium]|nr:porin family protein [Candidatus Cloacimonadota bacterium]